MTLREKLIQAVEFHIDMANDCDQDEIMEQDVKDLKALHYDLTTGRKINWDQYCIAMLLTYIDEVLEETPVA